jgi:predicted RNA binding protein YcfA (HicA-like mRNA interferase family)
LGKGVFFFGFARPVNWSQLKNLSANDLIRYLRQAGITVETTGSKRGTKAVVGGKKVPIPMHGKKTLKQKTLRRILKELGLIK